MTGDRRTVLARGLRVLFAAAIASTALLSDAAATSESRRGFVRSCIRRFIKGDLSVAGGAGGAGAAAGVFDGIDIDWEFPVCCGAPGTVYRSSDKAHATRLFREFRRQLDA